MEIEVLAASVAERVLFQLTEEQGLMDLNRRLRGGEGGVVWALYLPMYRVFAFIGAPTSKEAELHVQRVDRLLSSAERTSMTYLEGIPPLPHAYCNYGIACPDPASIVLPTAPPERSGTQPKRDHAVFVYESAVNPTGLEQVKRLLRARCRVSLAGAFEHRPTELLRATFAIVRRYWTLTAAQDLSLATFASTPLDAAAIEEVLVWLKSQSFSTWTDTLTQFVGAVQSSEAGLRAGLMGFILVVRELQLRRTSYSKEEIIMQVVQEYTAQLYPGENLVSESAQDPLFLSFCL